MAVRDQVHVHSMQSAGLNGSIRKDARGQRYGLIIALSGLLVAGIIAPFSPTAAAIVGGLDLFGIVALFTAPRVLEWRNASRRDGEEQGKR